MRWVGFSETWWRATLLGAGLRCLRETATVMEILFLNNYVRRLSICSLYVTLQITIIDGINIERAVPPEVVQCVESTYLVSNYVSDTREQHVENKCACLLYPNLVLKNTCFLLTKTRGIHLINLAET